MYCFCVLTNECFFRQMNECFFRWIIECIFSTDEYIFFCDNDCIFCIPTNENYFIIYGVAANHILHINCWNSQLDNLLIYLKEYFRKNATDKNNVVWKYYFHINNICRYSWPAKISLLVLDMSSDYFVRYLSFDFLLK